MCLKEPYAQKLVMLNMGCQFLITVKKCPSLTEHNEFKHRNGKKQSYFVILNGSEMCTISVAPETHNYLVYTDQMKAKLYRMIKTEEMRLARECVFIRDGEHRSA